MYYLGMSYTEIYNIPLAYKHWFFERLTKEIEKSRETGSGQTRGAHHNTPEMREIQGMQRAQVPSRLRRFT